MPRKKKALLVLTFLIVVSLGIKKAWGRENIQPEVVVPEKQAEVFYLGGFDKGLYESFFGAGKKLQVGEEGDFVADKVFGQLDFTQNVPNEVVGNRVFHPAGVLIDRGVTPNRVYVWDSGNSRILGFSSLGSCEGGIRNGAPCTNSLDCSSATCKIDPNKEADIVIGQLDKFHATCNGDNTQVMPASASSLCSQTHPFSISLMESPEPTSLAVDDQHNLYVFDKYNNRVLRYNDPFLTDTVADGVWGQADFVQRGLNRGRDPVGGVPGFPAEEGSLGNNTLHSGYLGGDYIGGGVDVDEEGNLWVADGGNHRILRFPFSSSLGQPSPNADLVIGQGDFTSRLDSACVKNFDEQIRIPKEKGERPGNWPWYLYPPQDRICRPKAVRYSRLTGKLYVIDWPDAEGLFRVLIYNPPFTTGMDAVEVLHGDWHGFYEYQFRRLTSLEVDHFVPEAFWISNSNLNKIEYFQKINGQWSLTKRLTEGLEYPSGGVGIDSEGNIYAATLHLGQEIKRFKAPIPSLSDPGGDKVPYEIRILPSQDSAFASPNKVSGKALRNPSGVLLARYQNGQDQMIVLDQSRILFWNDYKLKQTGSSADGVLFEPNFETTHNYVTNFAVKEDSRGRIWVARENSIYFFQGPLVDQQNFDMVIPSNLPLRGRGMISLGNWITGLAYNEESDALWLADSFNHRLVRLSRPFDDLRRQVDMVLGQPDINSTKANRGADDPDQNICPNIVADGFGNMGALEMDQFGNLYVVDGVHEGWGCSNNRLLEFDKETLVPDPNKIFFAQGERVPKRVYGGSDFTEKNKYFDPNPYTPISVSFFEGKMLMVADGYGNPYLRRVFLYNNPLPNCSPSCWVSHSEFLPIPGAQLRSSSWDNEGNLVILDHTWNRVLYFKKPFIANCSCSENVPPKNKGNANCDEVIDIRDFGIWRNERWGRTNTKNADFNCDNIVDIRDFQLWLNGKWGR